MNGKGLILALLVIVMGCRAPLRTESTVRFAAPVETRVHTEFPPVVPDGGPLRSVTIETGSESEQLAIVDVDGPLFNFSFVGPGSAGENPVALFREKLDAVEANPNVRAVILRVNSPGGGVAACMAMRHDLVRFKARCAKPVVACLLDTSTGGAYYLASAADLIVAGPATVTGGIGVILNLYNLQDLMAQFNIVPQPIKAGHLIDLGTSARKLRPEEESILQTMADEFHHHLKSDISHSRKQLDPSDASLFDGRIFSGSQAKKNNLIDHIGDIDTAIQLASGSCQCRPSIVMYRRANDHARTPYAAIANQPLQGTGLLPSVPGLDRSRMPTFLSMWQPELTMEKLGGK